MALRSISSVWPLYGAAGLALMACLFIWPEPLASGWEWPTLAAGIAGALGSMRWWRAAQAEAMAAGESGLRALAATVLAGVLVAITLLHLANAMLPPGTARTGFHTVTEKFVTRGRRGHKSYRVATTPVPGETGNRTVHRVGGLYGTNGGWRSYAVGGCMLLRWRPGWLWPVVIERRAATCPAPAAPSSRSSLPLARPGPAWAGIQQRLARDVAALPLPPQGVRIEMAVTADSVGRITAIRPLPGSTPLSPIATEIVGRAIMRQPGALTQAGEYRMWLLLRPAGQG